MDISVQEQTSMAENSVGDDAVAASPASVASAASAASAAAGLPSSPLATVVTECGICLDELSEPRLLPCLHSFCTTCLLSLDGNADAAAAAAGDAGEVLTCPLCRHTVRLSKDDGGVMALPVNRLAADAVKLHKNARAGRADCDLCDDVHAAQFYCSDCSLFLCEEQGTIHRKSKTTKTHTLKSASAHLINNVPGDSSNSARLTQLTRQPVMCAKHPAYELEVACDDCGVVLCTKCAYIDHKTHATLAVDEALPNHRLGIQTAVAATRARLPLLTNTRGAVTATIAAVLAQSSEAHQAISQAFAELNRVVNERQAALQADLRSLVEAKVKTLELQREQLEALESHFTAGCDFASAVVQSGTAVEIVQLHRMLDQRLSDLLSSPVAWVPFENARFNASFTGSASEFVAAFGDLSCDSASGADCVVGGDGARRAQLGRRQNFFTVIAKDRKGQRRTKGGDSVWVYLHPVNATSQRRVLSTACVGPDVPQMDAAGLPTHSAVTIVDKADGLYDVCYDVYELVPHKLVVMVNGQPIAGSPFTVAVFPERNMKEISRAVCVFGGQEHLQAPYGVTTGPNGELVVADYGHRLQVFSQQGQYLRTIGQGMLRNPHGVTLLPDNTLLVADGGNKELKQISMDGKLLQVIACDFPFGVATLRSGEFVATEYAAHRVKIFSPQGRLIRVMGTGRPGTDLTQFNHPTGVAVTPKGELVVLDCDNHRVLMINPQDGQVIRHFGGLGSEPGQLRHPNFVAVTPSGFILISDRVNNRVQVFTGEGVFVHMFDGGGGGGGLGGAGAAAATAAPAPAPALAAAAEGGAAAAAAPAAPAVPLPGLVAAPAGAAAGPAGTSFNQPVGICITEHERVVVTEYGSRRVQIF